MIIEIGMPVYSGVHPEVVRNLIQFDLQSQTQRNNLILNFPKTSLVSLSRNNIMKDAVKNNADWCLMWDSDIQIKDQDFFNKMVKTAYDYNVPVVALPCRLKVPEVIYNFAVKKDNKYENFKELPKTPIETDVIGTGVMLINMAFIRENIPKAPYFTVIDTEAGVFPEDWAFCEKIKEKGGKIIMLPLQTVHWGELGYTFSL